MIAGIPVEIVLFAATLAAVALAHRHVTAAALAGLAAILAYKLLVAGFAGGPGLVGLAHHAAHEWVGLANLFGLLVAFALLARQFEASGVPDALPAILPRGAAGAFALLVLVFAMSAILDNIAAALIGGTIAARVFGDRVHTGYVAALVAAANAGGAGSVVGDTTTTMIWIAGVSPATVLRAYVAALPALVVCGIVASIQQDRLSPIRADAAHPTAIDWTRLACVAAVLLAAVAVNAGCRQWTPELAAQLPVLGGTVLLSVAATGLVRHVDWAILPEAASGAVFLLALVAAASLVPVAALPAASLQVTFGLGLVSAVFDNIPLTALALRQGGFDWGLLAYAVGFGGSMIWFGSSAGVAIVRLFPHARSAGGWVAAGWHVAAGYVVGFAAYAILLGWRP